MNHKEIVRRAEELSPQIIELRRALHRRPELSYHEYETAAFVSDHLRALGLEVKEGVFGTGVIGLLRGKEAGKTVALRADMDALPVSEKADVVYKSQIVNRMHACGHDGHSAMLLGAASLLTPMRERLAGNIKFIFQPAEEVPPEGGAKGMIADGALHDPDVDAIFGVHIWPEVLSGEVGIKTGPIMAEADKFEILIHGSGAHGASPHQGVDTIVTAAQVVMAVQTLVSRRVDPVKPAVLSICKCNGGTAYNILPEEMRLEGTTRYFDPALGSFLEAELDRMLQGVCEANHASYELFYRYGYPPTVNEPEMTALAARAAGVILGEEKLRWVEAPSMTGEDFSFYLQKVPGCFFWLGTKNPDEGITAPLHSPFYRLDENVLKLGTAILAKIALDHLCS